MEKIHKQKTKRMDKPDDTLFKRQSSNAGDVIHSYHRFPGKYLRPLANEYPNVGGGVPRTDSSYLVDYNGQECVVNWEDESTSIGLNTLKKCNNYRINLEYTKKIPVISVITTLAPLERCKTQYEPSPTIQFKPIIRSYLDCEGGERLNRIKSKIMSDATLSNVEAMDLIMIPKMYASNQDIVLEEVVNLLSLSKLEDNDFKLELIFQMQCVIHKYAKTIDDIDRLEKVIGLQKAMTAMEFRKEMFRNACINEGAFEMAVRVKHAFGIDEAVKLSGFSKEELENEKLNE